MSYLDIEDFAQAQKLADNFRVAILHKALDRFAALYCPILGSLQATYHWSLMQVEYATDIVFNQPEDLKTLYDSLVRTSMSCRQSQPCCHVPGP